MFEARPSAIDDGIERRDVMSAASIVAGSLRPPGSDTYVDHRHAWVIEWTPTVLAGFTESTTTH
jgi:hypothetical protein